MEKTEKKMGPVEVVLKAILYGFVLVMIFGTIGYELFGPSDHEHYTNRENYRILSGDNGKFYLEKKHKTFFGGWAGSDNSWNEFDSLDQAQRRIDDGIETWSNVGERKKVTKTVIE